MDQQIFIYPKDLVILTGKHYNTCLKMYNIIRDSLGKSWDKRIMITE